jgi:hypothetical protein
MQSSAAAYSARGLRKNLRRAGTLPNRCSTRTRVPGGKAVGPSPESTPWSIIRCQPPAVPTRLSSVIFETLAIEGKASPRKPKVATISISSSGSFDVACRSSANSMSAGFMPQPSSVTSIKSIPPDAKRTDMVLAPESMAFSTSSFNALAGLSTTSPAAIRLTKLAGSLLIDICAFLAQAPLAGDSLIVRNPAKYLFCKTANSARTARLFWACSKRILTRFGLGGH